MSVSQPPPNRIATDSTLQKMFTVLETLFLLLTASYSGALSAFLTIPMYYPTVNTIDQFLESDLKWGSDSDIWIVSIIEDEDPKIKSFIDLFEVYPVEKLVQLSFERKLGLPVEITANEHVTVQNYSTEEVISNMHVMKTTLYGSPSATIMRKGSPYEDYYNKLIHRMLDSGLFLLWEEVVTQQSLSSSLQLAFKISSGNTVHPFDNTPIGLEHIQGAFLFLCFGFSMSILALTIERMQAKKLARGSGKLIKNP